MMTTCRQRLREMEEGAMLCLRGPVLRPPLGGDGSPSRDGAKIIIINKGGNILRDPKVAAGGLRKKKKIGKGTVGT